MLTDHNVDTYAEDTIRRHANGSIDYRFYDQRAREGRGIAFRGALKSLACLIARISAPRQAQTEQKHTQPRLQLVAERRKAAASPNAYSEAA